MLSVAAISARTDQRGGRAQRCSAASRYSATCYLQGSGPHNRPRGRGQRRSRPPRRLGRRRLRQRCYLRVVGGGGRSPDEALREAVELVVHGGHASSHDPPAATRGAEGPRRLLAAAQTSEDPRVSAASACVQRPEEKPKERG